MYCANRPYESEHVYNIASAPLLAQPAHVQQCLVCHVLCSTGNDSYHVSVGMAGSSMLWTERM